MRFVLDVTLTDEGKDADPRTIADALLELLCATDGGGAIQSYDECSPERER